MRIKSVQIALLALVMIGAVACQKEVDYVDLPPNNNPNDPGNPSGNRSIIGDWKFVKLTGVSTSITELTQDGVTMRNVSVTNVDSKDEKGTQRIDETTLTTTGVGYSMSSVVTGETFINGISTGAVSLPMNFTAPPTSGTSKYKKVTADSIYVEGGILNVDLQDQVSSLPVGAKISWLGDTLVLHVKTSIVQEITDPFGTNDPSVKGKSTAIVDYRAKYTRL